MTSLDRPLASLLRGESGVWASARTWTDDEFFSAAHVHGVTSLLFHQVQTTPAGEGCPPAIFAGLKQPAMARAAAESLTRHELRNVIDTFEAAGVRAILFKGTALAYSTYPFPALRERYDSDLLIESGSFVAADLALKGIGYHRSQSLGEGATSQQALFRKPNGMGGFHDLDVHWGICNRPLLKDFLTFSEIVETAVPLLGIHPKAMGPSRLHSLLIAAVHRVAHHKNGSLLGWLYDIHLLADDLSAASLDTFRRMAEAKGASAISADALALTIEALGSMPAHREWVYNWVSEAAARNEPTAIYLTRAPWIGDGALSDFATLPGWPARLRFLREIVLPRREYMFERYGRTSRVVLPVLHLRRLTVGLWNLCWRLAKDARRPRTDSVS